MSTTLANMIVPEIFFGYVDQERNFVNRLVTSGAVVNDPMLNTFLAGGGTTMNLPSYIPTESDSENVSSDALSSATPDNLTTGKEIVARFERNGSWKSADLVATLAGSDPIAAAARMAAQYQATKRQNLLVSMLNGLMGAGGPLANHVNDVSGASDITADAIIDTTSIFGDEQFLNGVLVMHSAKYRVLQKANLITFRPTSEQNVQIAFYLGYQVLVDDRMPVGATPTTYTTYLIAPGAIAEGNGRAKVPVAVEREELQGDGGGTEALIVRDHYTMHVKGVAWSGVAAGNTPTNAELATPGNWSKVFADKKIRVAALISD